MPSVYRHRIEYGEEPHLVPSHLFYLAGCNLRCVFCIGAPEAFDPNHGEPLTPDLFRTAVAWGRARGVRTLQWVGGEPNLHIDAILELMAQTPDLPPVVWKSNFYTPPETLARLAPSIAHFVADLKFGNATCAADLCGANDYIEVVREAIRFVYTLRPESLVIRHLLLPGHRTCCFEPIWTWCQEHTPRAIFSLRDGYMPAWHARDDATLRHALTAEDAALARAFMNHVR